MPGRDGVAGAQEDVDLPEVDALLLLVVARRLQHHEVAALVLLDLRALVLASGVFDGELGEVEGLGDPRQLFVGRMQEPDPDEAVAGARELGGLLDVERLLVLADALPVVGAVDYHGSSAPGSPPPAPLLPPGRLVRRAPCRSRRRRGAWRCRSGPVRCRSRTRTYGESWQSRSHRARSRR